MTRTLLSFTHVVCYRRPVVGQDTTVGQHSQFGVHFVFTSLPTIILSLILILLSSFIRAFLLDFALFIAALIFLQLWTEADTRLVSS